MCKFLPEEKRAFYNSLQVDEDAEDSGEELNEAITSEPAVDTLVDDLD